MTPQVYMHVNRSDASSAQNSCMKRYMCELSNNLSVEETETTILNPIPKLCLQNHANKDNRRTSSTTQIGPAIIPTSESIVDFNFSLKLQCGSKTFRFCLQ